MDKRLFSKFTGFYSLLLLMIAAANTAASGSGTVTITNLPTLGGTTLEVYGLNATGQITGYSFVAGDSAYHGFLYDAGTLTDLGTLGGSTSRGLALNNAGQVAGQADLAGAGQTHAFLYGGGSLLDLGTLGGSSSSPMAINDAGQVAGSSELSGNTATVAFLYANGSMNSLGTLGGGSSSALALNSSGMVVGQATVANGNTHGFVYSGGPMTDIGSLGSDSSSAFAINDAGVVAGESSTTNYETYGVVYAGGVLTDVGALGGTYSSAFGINSNGVVIGYATTSGNAELHAFAYSNGGMTDLGTLGGGYSEPAAINNLGAVVGTSETSDGADHAFVYQNGKMVDLNTLLPANSGWELTDARYINDAGRIVGYGTYNQVYRWFIMDVAAANTPPIAIAGPDQTVDCAAQVTLDGSQSSDPDHDPLTYEWSVGGTVLGTRVALATSLPIGTNVVTLKVTDPSGASAQTNVIIRVVDTTPPTVSCPASSTASADANCQAVIPNVLPQVVATDNCTSSKFLTLTQTPAAGTQVGLGPHTITVTATDPSGNTATCSTVFTVVDTTAPTILSLSASPNVLTPPNHQLVPVTVSVVATDQCDSAPVSKIIAITANAPAAPGDIQITGDLTASLAASKTSSGVDRIYTITVQCSDASGNTSNGTVTVTVPQNNGHGKH